MWPRTKAVTGELWQVEVRQEFGRWHLPAGTRMPGQVHPALPAPQAWDSREEISRDYGGGGRGEVGEQSVSEHRRPCPWLGLGNAGLRRLSGRVSPGAKTQLISELSRGWASRAEETACRGTKPCSVLGQAGPHRRGL